jgi:hypothetical protein
MYADGTEENYFIYYSGKNIFEIVYDLKEALYRARKTNYILCAETIDDLLAHCDKGE